MLVVKPLVFPVLAGLPRLPGPGPGPQQALAEGSAGRAGAARASGGDAGAAGQAAQPPGEGLQGRHRTAPFTEQPCCRRQRYP